MKPGVIGMIAASAVMLASAQLKPLEPGGSSSATALHTTRAAGYYDTRLERVVLIGGVDQPTAVDRDRVWSWSGSNWDVVTSSGPAGRNNGAAAFDSHRRIGVVAGGASQVAGSATFQILSDTWLGSATGWQRMTGAEFDARDHQSMVYDDGRRALLMFGGIPADRSVPWPSDTWQLDEAGWRRIATEGPAGRGRAALVHDSKRRQVVLFGGVGGASHGQPQPFFNDTWSLEGTRWRQASTEGPRARYAHGMVFDERAGVVLLYSGAAAHRNAPLTDMWQWDGMRWSEIQLSGATPGYRYQPVMVYDRRRGKTVLYGGIEGSQDDTWEWDGRRWTEVHP